MVPELRLDGATDGRHIGQKQIIHGNHHRGGVFVERLDLETHDQRGVVVVFYGDVDRELLVRHAAVGDGFEVNVVVVPRPAHHLLVRFGTGVEVTATEVGRNFGDAAHQQHVFPQLIEGDFKVVFVFDAVSFEQAGSRLGFFRNHFFVFLEAWFFLFLFFLRLFSFGGGFNRVFGALFGSLGGQEIGAEQKAQRQDGG